MFAPFIYALIPVDMNSLSQTLIEQQEIISLLRRYVSHELMTTVS